MKIQRDKKRKEVIDMMTTLRIHGVYNVAEQLEEHYVDKYGRDRLYKKYRRKIEGNEFIGHSGEER